MHRTRPGRQAFRAWEKITPRAALAAGVSFAVAVLLGPRWIAWLDGRFREPIKSDSPEVVRLHRQKQATPTMGGLFIIAALLASVLLFGDPRNGYIVRGPLDGRRHDAGRHRRRSGQASQRRQGALRAARKLAAQVAVALLAAILLYQQQAAVADGLLLRVPCTGMTVSLGLWFIPLALLVIVGASNAVNLTDGLDGLAGGCLMAATVAMTALVYAAGHAEWAAYLGVPRIPHAGEMTVLAGGMIGGVLGFLWFNCHPAQVFMGNTGALPLGGLLGCWPSSLGRNCCWWSSAACSSSRRPASSFKWATTSGGGGVCCGVRPLHHHFQLLGWAENKIVVRFWIAAVLCALLGTASLKLTTDGGRGKAEGGTETDVGVAVQLPPQQFQQFMSPSNEEDVSSLFGRSNPFSHRKGATAMKRNTVHIVFAGGGTGGHLFPGLAVAQRLAATVPRARITFCGAGKPFERRAVSHAGFDYLALPARPLPAMRGKRWRFWWKTWPAIWRRAVSYAKNTWRRSWAWAATPACRWPARRRGGGCRWCCWSKTRCRARPPVGSRGGPRSFCTAFPETGGLLRCRCPIRVTGNPVRAGFLTISRRARKELTEGQEPAPPSPPSQLLVLGGSGGARCAQRERSPRVVQDPRPGGRLEDYPPIGRSGLGSHADVVYQAGFAGHGPAVSRRHAGGTGDHRSGRLPSRRHDAGRTGGHRGSGRSAPLSTRHRRSPGGQRPGLCRPRRLRLQSTSATCPGGSTTNWPTCYVSCWPTMACGSGCRRRCASWPGPTRPMTWPS